MDISFEQKVREKAYEIWMAAGQEDGAAHDHWVAAEQVLINETVEPKKATKKAAAAKVPAKTSTKTAAKAKVSAKTLAKTLPKATANAKGSSATH